MDAEMLISKGLDSASLYAHALYVLKRDLDSQAGKRTYNLLKPMLDGGQGASGLVGLTLARRVVNTLDPFPKGLANEVDLAIRILGNSMLNITELSANDEMRITHVVSALRNILPQDYVAD